MIEARCDVLVVGLGPAGARAAEAAARAGCSVVGIDRRTLVGVPVQCAEFVPLPLAGLAPAGVRAQTVARMVTHLPSGRCETSAMPGLMLRRDRFDQTLVGAAADAGAIVRTDTALHAFDAMRGEAQLRSTTGSHRLAWRVAIAADGPHSTVAARLGLPRLRCLHTRQYTIPLARPGSDVDVWLAADLPGGYAWLFPKGDVANLGLGVDPHFARDLKSPLDALHARLVDEGRVGRGVLARTGGPIPVGGMRSRLAIDRVLFAGDAAGLAHPVTGAGIAAAVHSGALAGLAAARWLAGDPCAHEDYETELRDTYAAAFARALGIRRQMQALWNTPAAGSDAVHRSGWIAFREYGAARCADRILRTDTEAMTCSGR